MKTIKILRGLGLALLFLLLLMRLHLPQMPVRLHLPVLLPCFHILQALLRALLY